MARKNYSDEFRRQAVDLYESTPGATVRGIAEDLGRVERGTLRHWLDLYGTGKKTRPTAPRPAGQRRQSQELRRSSSRV
jgi:transposase